MIGNKIGKTMAASASIMEPMLPSQDAETLRRSALEVVRESAALGAALHPVTRRVVIQLLRRMNSYYSNLIEGHNTRPVDIDRALRKNYSKEPAKRALQIESAAHVEVQELIDRRLHDEPSLDVCGRDFLCWVHRSFYERMPEEFTRVRRDDGRVDVVVPGTMRTGDVRVGRHLAPPPGALATLLARFGEAYLPDRLDGVDGVLAAGASHHRLLWIHPFLDGNGRVARLFTHAYLARVKIDAHGLWTATRGFARARGDYVRALEDADEPRRGDLDGRGNLSDMGLSRFCGFFLQTALDQIQFMRGLLDLDALQERIVRYGKISAARGEGRAEAGILLRDVMLRGEITRGEAARISGLKQRSAQSLLAELLRRGLLTSESPKGPVRLGLPAGVAGYYFPRLYPESVEMEMG